MHCYFSKTLLLLWLLLPTAAVAEFNVCNNTPQSQFVALAHNADGDWVAQGWWEITAGDCAELVSGDLTSRFFYIRLRAEAEAFLHNSVKFCVADDSFDISDATNCARQAALYPADFARVEVRHGADAHSVELSDFLRAVPDDDSGQSRKKMDAVFQNCRDISGSKGQVCSFVGEGQEILVRANSDTASQVLARLEVLRPGERVILVSKSIEQGRGPIEIELSDLQKRPPGPEQEILQAIQGTWVSVSDPNDSFTVYGATRQNSYLGAETGQEFLSISARCLDYEFDGLALHSWSKDDSQGLCYLIEHAQVGVLKLRFLPSGRRLSYRRADLDS